MAMVAHEVPRAIVLLSAQRIEGNLVLETNCRDYDNYKTLPDVVAYEGTLCAKTGWSSDRYYACYQSRMAIARGITTP